VKELYPLTGVVAIPQTPFDEDDGLDLDSLMRAVDDRLAAGVDGLLYPVVASEVGRLTTAERHAATKAVIDRVAGRVPVIVGSSADDARDARAMAGWATEQGADGVLVQAPVAMMRDVDATLDYFRLVCEAPIRMLMIQDLEWGAPGLPVPTIVRLFEELEPFRCIKVETVPAGSKYTAILAATDGRLNVSGGWAVPQLIEALDRGVHAVMPGGLHWPLVAIIRKYREGDRAGAMRLFDRLLPILAWQNQHIDISNQFLKLLAVRQGIFRSGALRNPQVPFDSFHHRIAAELIEQSMTLHADVGWRPS
jgi:4-hydroxy-tetrahydrodipicolinate synthase